MADLDCYLFDGQSNMGAFGTLNNTNYVTPWNALMYGSAFAEVIWNGGGWVQYIPGVASYFGGGAQFWGPEASFALAKRGAVIPKSTYILKFWLGGVGMAPSYGNNTFSHWQRGKAFDTLCAMAEAAMNALVPYGNPVLRTECIIVGESDCFYLQAAQAMKHDAPLRAEAMRNRFGSNLKVIMGSPKLTLGSQPTSVSPYNLPYVEILRAGLSCFKAASPKNGLVDLDGFAANTDSLGHYDRSAQPGIGQAFFNEEAAI